MAGWRPPPSSSVFGKGTTAAKGKQWIMKQSQRSSTQVSSTLESYDTNTSGTIPEKQVWRPRAYSTSDLPAAPQASVQLFKEEILENHVTIPPKKSRYNNALPYSLQPGTSSTVPQKSIWRPRSYSATPEPPSTQVSAKLSTEKVQKNHSAIPTREHKDNNFSVHKLLNAPVGANFIIDNQTYCKSQIRAIFYPKFENEKSDQEVRMRMIEMVSSGLATLEVSLKHSGSLFMYAGSQGGAYAKNSFGNIYTAVGVFVLSRMFSEAWGTKATKQQEKFSNFLEKNHMSISMELVTAVLGDHGQRPLQDYVVVTAVTELGNGKPKFYSTPEVIAFCRKWRLPTNHVWLFSTRKSVTSFFAAYDAMYEEGTATPVCRALDEVADISVPGSKDHIRAQGEILEGVVARIVSPNSSKHMEEVLAEFASPVTFEANEEMGPSLREICAANRSDEPQQIRALLKNAGSSICANDLDWFGIGGSVGGKTRNSEALSKFLQAQPSDFSTTRLQELVRLMKQRNFPVAFKCYHNFHKIDTLSYDNLHFKMVIHVHSDSVFRRYQQEMRHKPGLWPLYRGFFVDIHLFKANKDSTNELVENTSSLLKNTNISSTSSTTVDGLADEDANLMIKLKFLTYKLRTFLIRNGLPILFKEGPSAYRTYYLRQMKKWGTSDGKQRELRKMLDEWAVYITRKCGNKQLSSSTYLSEAEPFLEKYAKRSPENHVLVGSAGNLVRSQDFLAIVEEGRDEEGDLIRGGETTPLSLRQAPLDSVTKDEGLIVFFPGIPGCAKSALCKELVNTPGGFGDDRPMHSLMGDLIKKKYWQKVAEDRHKKPYTITLADKNAPNEDVWKQIEDMCHSTKASAVPVIPDSEGTNSNPFSLDALAVFIFRVLQRNNHPGNLDKRSPNVGYVLLMFYNLYDGRNRNEFEAELSERFGGLVRMPLLKADRMPLPDPIKDVLEEGIHLFMLHSQRHRKLEPSKGTYAKEWDRWEKQLRCVLLENTDYINSIQVPFDIAVSNVLEQLKAVARGEYRSPSTEKKKIGSIVFAAVSLPVDEVKSLLDKVNKKYPESISKFLKDKDMGSFLKAAHITLAHKRSHGVTGVASYGIFVREKVPIELTALLFSNKFAAFEARIGRIKGEALKSMNQWPHLTIWTYSGGSPKDANTLPELVSQGKATRVDLNPALTITGTVEFF